MRYMEMAHVVGSMAGNSRAADQTAVPSCRLFCAPWVLSVSCALILHCTWTLSPLMLCSYCYLTAQKAVLCHLDMDFCFCQVEFLLSQLISGIAVRLEMTLYLNKARECVLQIKKSYFKAAAVKGYRSTLRSQAWPIWKGVILPSKVSTILKNAREKEDFPLPVRPQIPICDTESRWTLGEQKQIMSVFDT